MFVEFPFPFKKPPKGGGRGDCWQVRHVTHLSGLTEDQLPGPRSRKRHGGG